MFIHKNAEDVFSFLPFLLNSVACRDADSAVQIFSIQIIYLSRSSNITTSKDSITNHPKVNIQLNVLIVLNLIVLIMEKSDAQGCWLDC